MSEIECPFSLNKHNFHLKLQKTDSLFEDLHPTDF